MITVAVVEDDAEYSAQVASYVKKFAEGAGEEMSVVMFSDGIDFISGNHGKCDIILLDIEMPGMNGLDAAHKLRSTGDKAPVIFITNMAQLAVRGYEVDALGFIVKPLTYYAFAERMKKAVAEVQAARNNYLAFSLKDGVVKIYLDDVKYVEVYRHSIAYHTFDGVVEVRGTMRETAELLADKHFAQCNSCWLVNLKYVSSVRGNEVRVADETLSISRNKRKDFLGKLAAYFSRGGEV